MKKAIVVGAGPSGVSAAIYLIRGGVAVTLIYRDKGALGKAEHVGNYYGFAEGISGEELFERGLAQARNLGVEIVNDEVVGLGYTEKLAVMTKEKTYEGDVVVLATGAARIAPKIQGVKEFEGCGVSYCAVCDAFFYRGKDVVVVGNGAYAMHEASELAVGSRTVRIVTMGKEPEFEVPTEGNIIVDKRKLVSISGNDAVESVEFDDGTTTPVDGVFLAVGIAGSADFAKKVGAETNGARIVVDGDCATTIPGLYACGDCVGGVLQIAKAVCDGAKAGLHAAKYLRDL